MTSVPRLALRISSLFLAVGMMGGYLWYTQSRSYAQPTPSAESTPSPPSHETRITSKSMAVIQTEPSPQPAEAPKIDPRITSKSADVVFTPNDAANILKPTTLTLEPSPDAQPRISSKLGSVFSGVKIIGSGPQPQIKDGGEEVQPNPATPPAEPRLSSKVGVVIKVPSPAPEKPAQKSEKEKEEDEVVEKLIGPDTKGPPPGFAK